MKRTEAPGSRWLRPHRIDVIDTRPLLKWLAQATNRIHVDAHIDQAAINSQFERFGNHLNNGESKKGVETDGTNQSEPA